MQIIFSLSLKNGSLSGESRSFEIERIFQRIGKRLRESDLSEPFSFSVTDLNGDTLGRVSVSETKSYGLDSWRIL